MTAATQQGRRPFSLHGALEVVVKVIALGVPILYVTGRIYSEAYWGQLRIPPALLEYTVPDYLYLGFVAIATALANTVGLQVSSKLGYLALFAVGFGAVAVGLSVINRSIGQRLKAKIERAAQHARDSISGEARRHFALFGSVSSVFFALIYVVLFGVFLLLLPMALISKAGSAAGERERAYQSSATEIYDHGVAPKARMRAHYRLHGSERTSMLVECGRSWCVVFDSGAFSAIPMQAVWKIDQAPRVGENATAGFKVTEKGVAR